VSVLPLETEFGRKREIDQSNCNKDFSCVKGFCPSFVTVEGGVLAKRAMDSAALAERAAKLPQPGARDVSSAPQALLVTGIGGTGVLTVGAVLAMAAHLEGKAAKVLDQTGMAQKGGAVTSHIRIGADSTAIPSARLGMGQADAIIACDLVVASGPEVLSLARADTQVVANDTVVPTGEFQTNRALDLSAGRFITAMSRRIDAGKVAKINAGELASRLLGDTIFTNMMMLGFAAQRGLLPVSLASLEQAIRLNGVATRANLDALALGRLAAAGTGDLIAMGDDRSEPVKLPVTYAEVLQSRARLLTDYQNAAYAQHYRDFMADIERQLANRRIAGAEAALTAAAHGLGRLMAYKDEYEVARLYSAPAFRAALDDQFAAAPRLKVHLAPPLLPLGKDARTGRPRKIAFGPWIFPLFRLLAKGKRLRGTALDPFGHTAERRTERALISEYRSLIARIAAKVTPATMEEAVDLLDSVDLLAGYGPVKLAGIEAFRRKVAASAEFCR
jgi:indolepyruvate ferredoxin oxidoreductase